MPPFTTLEGMKKNLGGFSVSRLIPQPACRSLGPFVFFDALGPADFAAHEGIDVRPHPHIGLATITWLFEGALTHRDSLGTVIDITPGAVNWMTAGHGITHSERTPDTLRAEGHRIHALQAWVALPRSHEETEPSFQHVAAADLPVITRPGARITLIAGTLDGHASPVVYPHPILYAALDLDAGAAFDLLPEWGETGLFLVHGEADLEGAALIPETLARPAPGKATLKAEKPSKLMLLAGAPMTEPRHLEWNFVHHDKARIADAVERWRKGDFPMVPGETEFIPY
ncbi:MAG: pirin family protein [Polymorphobacter sp.]|uniref:pirin family protein n=1 Tax=Polymorphobacter sp. TaxID=1909290 RepID=UPI003A858A81